MSVSLLGVLGIQQPLEGRVSVVPTSFSEFQKDGEVYRIRMWTPFVFTPKSQIFWKILLHLKMRACTFLYRRKKSASSPCRNPLSFSLVCLFIVNMIHSGSGGPRSVPGGAEEAVHAGGAPQPTHLPLQRRLAGCHQRAPGAGHRGGDWFREDHPDPPVPDGGGESHNSTTSGAV